MRADSPTISLESSDCDERCNGEGERVTVIFVEVTGSI